MLLLCRGDFTLLKIWAQIYEDFSLCQMELENISDSFYYFCGCIPAVPGTHDQIRLHMPSFMSCQPGIWSDNPAVFPGERR